MRARRFRLLAVPALTLALVAAAACSKKTTTTASPTSAPTFAAGTTMARLQAAGKITVGPSEIPFNARIPRARKGGPQSLLDMLDDDVFGSPTFSSTQQMSAESMAAPAGPIFSSKRRSSAGSAARAGAASASWAGSTSGATFCRIIPTVRMRSA